MPLLVLELHSDAETVCPVDEAVLAYLDTGHASASCIAICILPHNRTVRTSYS